MLSIRQWPEEEKGNARYAQKKLIVAEKEEIGKVIGMKDVAANMSRVTENDAVNWTAKLCLPAVVRALP